MGNGDAGQAETGVHQVEQGNEQSALPQDRNDSGRQGAAGGLQIVGRNVVQSDDGAGKEQPDGEQFGKADSVARL